MTDELPFIQARALFDRAPAHVARWHAKKTTGSESVAEHQFFTAYLAFVIADVLAELQWGVSPDWAALLGLLHDQAEVITGDVPHPVKRDNPGLMDELEADAAERLSHVFGDRLMVGDVVRRLIVQADDGDGNEPVVERQVVKLADRLAALAFVHEEIVAGNDHLQLTRFLASQQTLDDFGDLPWWPDLCEEIPDLEPTIRAWATMSPPVTLP